MTGLRLVPEIREGEQVPQTEGRKMCRKSTSPVATNSYTSDGIKIRMDTLCQKSDELGGLDGNFIMQWCRGGLRVAEKVSSKRNQYPLTTIYGQERK